jgi:cAMP-dependent protein kinase regulator
MKQKKASMRLRNSVCAEVFGQFNKKEEFIPRVIPKSEDQINLIKTRIMENFMFNSLDEKDLKTVIDAMEESRFKLGDTIIKEGDNGEVLYLVENGKLDCFKNIEGENKFIKSYSPGDAFGELALLYNAPRAATIIAQSECLLWALDRATFNNIVKTASIKKREMHFNFLKKVEILSSIDEYEIYKICDALKTKKYKSGEYIIKQGDVGDNFYIIEEGQAYASKTIENSNFDLFR